MPPVRTNYPRVGMRAGGFTLIELLVVLGVIAVLMSLLLPTLKNARLVAQSMKCTSNLKQIGLSCSMYASDYEDYIQSCLWIGSPTATWYAYNVVNGAAQNSCAFKGTSSYLGSYMTTPSVFICPASTIPSSVSMTGYCSSGFYTSFPSYNYMMRKQSQNYTFSPGGDGAAGIGQYNLKPLFFDPVKDMTAWIVDVSVAEIHGDVTNPLPILMSDFSVFQFDRKAFPRVWSGAAINNAAKSIVKMAN